MRPLDPRLLRYARSTRAFLIMAIVVGIVTALLVIVQARLLSDVIVSVTSQDADWSDVSASVLAIALVFAGRALLAWLAEVAAVRSSARAKSELRQAAVSHVLALGPAAPTAQEPGATAALLTRGIDALDGYYARYLPQLVLAVIVPIAVVLTVLGQDLLSTVIIVVTLPLIPVFMILIGLYTRGQVDRQWRTLARLSGHFLDLVSGLPTLVVFGRAKSQAQAIRAIGDRYRSTTMGVLRVSFLSSLALELLATLSVALVAVSVGLRLAEGQITYSVALFVLLLAPEAYLPLRLVGQHFHAAAEGLGAAERLFAIVETPAAVGGDRALPAGPVSVMVSDLQVEYPTRPEPALSGATLTARPGTVTAVVGASGGGKSTLLAALLGFVPASSGSIVVAADGTAEDLSTCDLDQWRRRVAWLPQQAHLVGAGLEDAPTVGEALRLGRPDASDDEVWAAVTAAGMAQELRSREGLDTRLSADGSGFSVGQRQRLALARTILVGADVVLLDEPTAALDAATESAVVDAVQQLATGGATVIVVAHRPALIDIADQVLRLDRRPQPEPASPVASSAADTIRSAGW